VPAAIKMVGRRFGRLIVLREMLWHRAPNGLTVRRFRVRCDCGTLFTVYGAHLRSGNTRSCGCLKLEILAENFTKHGDKRETNHAREYNSWSAMLQRCYYKKNRHYKDYGARGIKVCARWRKSYPAFLKDMGRRPSPEHSLDRIDNDGNYTPHNCRWATASQQQTNKRPRRRKRKK
jgi:hypothetical protein